MGQEKIAEKPGFHLSIYMILDFLEVGLKERGIFVFFQHI